MKEWILAQSKGMSVAVIVRNKFHEVISDDGKIYMSIYPHEDEIFSRSSANVATAIVSARLSGQQRPPVQRGGAASQAHFKNSRTEDRHCDRQLIFPEKLSNSVETGHCEPNLEQQPSTFVLPARHTGMRRDAPPFINRWPFNHFSINRCLAFIGTV
jgi:hypothetical protein